MKPSEFLNQIPSERLEQHNMTREDAASLLDRLGQAGVQVSFVNENDRVSLSFHQREND